MSTDMASEDRAEQRMIKDPFDFVSQLATEFGFSIHQWELSDTVKLTGLYRYVARRATATPTLPPCVDANDTGASLCRQNESLSTQSPTSTGTGEGEELEVLLDALLLCDRACQAFHIGDIPAAGDRLRSRDEAKQAIHAHVTTAVQAAVEKELNRILKIIQGLGTVAGDRSAKINETTRGLVEAIQLEVSRPSPSRPAGGDTHG